MNSTCDDKNKITLREYVDSLFLEKDKRYEQKFNDTKIAVDAALIAADKAVAAALAGQKEAVTKAETAAEKRFESVNEFRNTLSDQQRNLMPRSEVEIQIKNLNEKIDLLKTHETIEQGKSSGINSSWAVVIGIVGIISAIVGIASKFL